MSAQEYGKIIARNLRRIASDAGKSQADIDFIIFAHYVPTKGMKKPQNP